MPGTFEQNNSADIIPNFEDSKYVSAEEKKEIFQKMKEMGLKLPNEKDFSNIDNPNYGNVSIEEKINTIVSSREKKENIRLRQTSEGLHVKEYLYNDRLIKSWAEGFDKTPDEIKDAIYTIFEKKFSGAPSSTDFIKQTDLLKLLQNYFENNFENNFEDNTSLNSNPDRWRGPYMMGKDKGNNIKPLGVSPITGKSIKKEFLNNSINDGGIDIKGINIQEEPGFTAKNKSPNYLDRGFNREVKEGYIPNENDEKFKELPKGLQILLTNLMQSGITIKDFNTVLSLKDKNNEIMYNGKKGEFSVSNENGKGIQDLIKLLGTNKYSTRALMTFPPTIIFSVGGENFFVGASVELTEKEQKIFEDLKSGVESNIEKERKANIKRALIKGLEKNGYNSIDFEGTDKGVRERLLNSMVETINRKEKNKKVFIKNSIIEGGISQSIVKTLQKFEKEQTFTTGNTFRDFVDGIDDIVSNKEIGQFKELFDLFIDNVLKNPDNFQTIGDPIVSNLKGKGKGKGEQHKNPSDNINPSFGVGGGSGTDVYIPKTDADPRKRIYKGEDSKPSNELEGNNEKKEKQSKKDILNKLLNFDDKGIEKRILKVISDKKLTLKEIVGAFKENGKLDKVNWNEIKEHLISDLLYTRETSDYPMINENFKDLNINEIKKILDKVEHFSKTYNKTDNFNEVLAKMIIKGFITKEILIKIYSKELIKKSVNPILEKIKKQIDEINNIV